MIASMRPELVRHPKTSPSAFSDCAFARSRRLPFLISLAPVQADGSQAQPARTSLLTFVFARLFERARQTTVEADEGEMSRLKRASFRTLYVRVFISPPVDLRRTSKNSCQAGWQFLGSKPHVRLILTMFDCVCISVLRIRAVLLGKREDRNVGEICGPGHRIETFSCLHPAVAVLHQTRTIGRGTRSSHQSLNVGRSRRASISVGIIIFFDVLSLWTASLLPLLQSPAKRFVELRMSFQSIVR